MRIGLIYLPHPYLNQPDAQAPIGLLYIAAYIRESLPNYDVKIFNLSSFGTFSGAIDSLPECDLYGITVTSLELLQANRFAKQLKETYPKCKIILGGPGTLTEGYVDWYYIDSICKGEVENGLVKILSDFENNKYQDIYEFESPQNLDILPFPARDMLGSNQGGNIFAFNKKYHGIKSTIILSSRGCPFKCPFCSSMFVSGKLRYRSPESVYEEIKEVKERYGIHQFRFSDDMFTANLERTYKICDLIRPLNLAWRISTRVKPWNKELAEALFSAGCKEVSFGVESFDDHVLKVLDKRTTAKDNVNAIRIAKEAGMTVRILFMIKTPGQTEDTVDLNISYLEGIKDDYDIIACTTFIPIPGCSIWENPNRYGVEIIDTNLDNYNFYFYGSSGENKIKDVIRLYNRDPEKVNKESQRFRNYLKETGKLNRG